MTQEEAKEFTIWFAVKLRKEITEILLVGLVIMFLYGVMPWQKDNSDTPGWFTRRSGLVIRVDNLTGCQYLEGGDGLTPRLDKNGKQVGCR